MRIAPSIKKQLKHYYLDQVKKAGEVVYIITAVSLTQDEESQMKQTLGLGYLDEHHVMFGVDEAIVGGLVIKRGSHVIDLSVRGKLQQLKQMLYTTA